MMCILSDEVIRSVKITYSAEHKISCRIMVEGIVALRSETPFVPVAEIPVVECYHIVVEEIGSASSS